MLDIGGSDENWTHFRGTDLRAIASVETVPVEWDEEANIIWKTAIHGRGWSSPVVYGDQIWVTTANREGTGLSAVCVDFKSGRIIHDILVFSMDDAIRKHDINSFASPTPAIEEGFVYVHFGSMGTACINTADGSVVWTRTDLECNHIQGPGSSAFLYNDLLILHYEGVDVRYLAGLDKRTGDDVWEHRLRSQFNSSPVYAAGNIYFSSTRGETIVIEQGRELNIVAENKLDGEIWATPAFLRNSIIMRTDSHLYRIAGK